MTTMLQLRGTCPACFGEFQLHDDSGKTVIGRHGWEEIGGRQVGVYHQAWHSGECFGVGWAPFELSPAGTFAYLNEVLFPRALSQQTWLDKLATGTQELRVEVTRDGQKMTLRLTPTSPEGSKLATVYVQREDGSVGYESGTAYQGELQRQLRQAETAFRYVMEDGGKLVKAATGWKLADLKDGSPKGPTVHFQREGARGPYCSSFSVGLTTTAIESKTTCTRCLKSLASEKKDREAREAIERDAATVTEYLRANGSKTKSDLKKGLGWDTKRVNKAIEQASRPWRDGKTQPGTIRANYTYPKPETFEAV